ncbi:MAG: beta-lactamase family protein [Clostridia bacterium]|nr:beta-lactamase family protein [Clostridia bacterium]
MPLNGETRKRIQAVLDLAVSNHELAGGNLLVLTNGFQTFAADSGWADIEKRVPVRHDSIFRLYSQTKPITAAAVALLMERGVIDIMDPVEQYLPGFRDQKVWTEDGLVPVNRPVTLNDLLSMTAGLTYPWDTQPASQVAELFERDHEEIRKGGGMDTVSLCNALGRLPLCFQPGERYNYSTCADVLGAVVEIADGRPFSRFLREEFFEPMRMKDTGFYVPAEKQDRFVTCYRRVPGGLEPYHGLHLCVGDYTREPAFASGGAGLVSTLDDYAAFASMLMSGGLSRGRRILREATVRWLTSPQLPQHLIPTISGGSLAGFSYGKLMRVCVNPGQYPGLASPGEYGWDGWLGTYFANIPEEGLTILFCENTVDTGTSAVVRKIRNLILG